MKSPSSTKMDDTSLSGKRLKYSILFVISSLIGFSLSFYAAYVESKVEENHDYKAMCDISSKISCTKVFSSSYAKGFGVLGKVFGENSLLNLPNGYLGIAFYGFFMVSGFLNNVTVIRIQYLLSILSVLLSFYLAYLLYFVLENLCILCVSTYIVNFINLITIRKKLSVSKSERSMTYQNKISTKKHK
ncbi:vitamin K epoxide reductase complex subunit 1-like protein 1 [Condylostylus longicornis]|uniref:vitamin K epoxide reductase complex subunit 1-like protein 1 n=1 Tax=Condylostylus longicornis TaxID=2530218 RepID=UPI00244DFF3B|nr:vitamin K epoxide reductase complex subunit 1-like protein 1 [Condylostylus longicornis]